MKIIDNLKLYSSFIKSDLKKKSDTKLEIDLNRTNSAILNLSKVLRRKYLSILSVSSREKFNETLYKYYLFDFFYYIKKRNPKHDIDYTLINYSKFLSTNLSNEVASMQKIYLDKKLNQRFIEKSNTLNLQYSNPHKINYIDYTLYYKEFKYNDFYVDNRGKWYKCSLILTCITNYCILKYLKIIK